jgi:hypothetical protein
LPGIGDTVLLDALADYIQGRVKLRKFCLVFENDLNRIWPRESLSPEERKKGILVFAKANNWDATFHDHDPGIIVRFKPLKL